MGTFNTIPHFKFWCQKVLPLVYDDSLSYMELLCKVINYLNHIIDDVNQIPEIINSLISDEKLEEIMSQLLDELREQIARANEGTNTTASFDRDKGELVWLNGTLVRITRDMLAGDRYVEEVDPNDNITGNYVKTSIEIEIKRIRDELDDEITAREQADNTLQDNIDAEALAREQADGTLQDNIDAEALARSEAVGSLQNSVNALNARPIYTKGQILSIFHNRVNAHAEFYLSDDMNRFAPIKWNIEVEDQPNGDTDVLVARDGDLLYKDGTIYIVCTWSDLSTYGCVIHSSEDLVHWKSHTISLGSLNTQGVIAPTLVEVGDDVYLYGAVNPNGDYSNCLLFYAKINTLSHETISVGTPSTFTCTVNEETKSLFDPCLFVYDNKLYLAANDTSYSYLFVNSGNFGQFSYVKTITPYAEATNLLANENGSVIGTVQRFHNEPINVYKNYPIDTIEFNIEDENVRGDGTLRKECIYIEDGRFQSAEHGGHMYITNELSVKLDSVVKGLDITPSIPNGYLEYINLGDFGTYEDSEGGIVHVGALRLVPRTIYGAQSNTSDNKSVAYYHFDVDAIVNPFNLTEFYVVFELASNVTVRLTGTNFNAEFNIPCLPKQRGRAIHFIKSPIYGWTVTDASISELALTGNSAIGYVYGNVCNISVTVTSATAGDTIVSGCPAPWKREYIYPCLIGDDGTVIPCYLGSDGEIKVRSNVSSTARMNLEYICQ